MANDAINPWQVFKFGGEPLARGTLEFFENGQTVTQKDIFSDSDLQNPQDNPYELSDYGQVRGDVHYAGLATVVVRTASGIFARQLDDVAPSSDGNSGGLTKYRDSVAAMVADTSLETNDIVRTLAYYAGTEVAGARYLIVPANTGTIDGYRYHGLGNGLQGQLLDIEKRVNPLYAGALGDGGSNDTVPLQKVIDMGGDVEIPQGYSFVFTNLEISQNIQFVGGGTLRRQGSSSGDGFQITSTDVTFVKFRGVTLDANQANGNDQNNMIGWVLA